MSTIQANSCFTLEVNKKKRDLKKHKLFCSEDFQMVEKWLTMIESLSKETFTIIIVLYQHVFNMFIISLMKLISFIIYC